jgi:hypothetical protein
MVAVHPALALLGPSLLPSLSPPLALSTHPEGRPGWGLDPGPGAFSRALQASLSGIAGHEAAPGSSAGARPRRFPGELDPATRQAIHLWPPGPGLAEPFQPLLPTLATTAPAGTPGSSAQASLEEILPALVRKIAWSGDARRGAVRIELGAGALSGSTLLVATDGARLRIELRAHNGVELEPWRERIIARLAARGIDADVI